ncbi:MAG: transcriptional repressor [Anaerococcus sp.]|nr:transcriptional repressor [Anaerococcus sp.]
MQRHTIQRQIISQVIDKLEGHKSANEIYQIVIKDYPSISKSTVIRSLDLFCDMGKLVKREVANGPYVYDTITSDHYHIKCVSCGQIFDADMDFIPDLDKYIKDKKGFAIMGHDINFKGLCPKCRNKK